MPALRATDRRETFDVDDAQQLYAWIVPAILRFHEQLAPIYRASLMPLGQLRCWQVADMGRTEAAYPSQRWRFLAAEPITLPPDHHRSPHPRRHGPAKHLVAFHRLFEHEFRCGVYGTRSGVRAWLMSKVWYGSLLP